MLILAYGPQFLEYIYGNEAPFWLKEASKADKIHELKDRLENLQSKIESLQSPEVSNDGPQQLGGL